MIAVSQPVVIEHNGVPIEVDLCDLLTAMNIGVKHSEKSASDDTQAMPLPTDVQDVLMSEDPSYHSDAGSECSSSSSSSTNAGSHGCAYLRTISSQLDSFATTSGEYLEAIFTHREIFSAYPGAHPQCARGFSDIAYAMEQRAWRADRDADIEAVNAFRHEAWMIAAYMQ